MAIHFERGEVEIGQSISVESICGSVFEGSVVSGAKCGPFNAIVPQVTGSAHITGLHTFVVDPEDPMKNGFLLR